MVAFMLILIGISGLYSSLFGRNSKGERINQILILTISVVFLAYGSYIIYLYYGGTFGRSLLVGNRHKTAFSLVDTIGIGLIILSAISGRLAFKNKKD
ncbi:hypothetical protein M2475_000331 [Breznakia sp. PF5-3]|uniref:hypothetical protein n=1 Tax=unclassified Breznakia TaxID=2623764 RepID=UPI002405D971|nr:MULTISPECIES: hypothetical protein [unclassified Breznakia]MDF9823983.1 hypothetical protein [Breznakia sp. PM6-1]MDF9834782.1 hypothetical protein [Breznakia sp. PF5-3]MDF9838049.1 hypothetical protein [Breznakia sp. PFB2-8]MDF9860035.1 hypothetical protein [Breznakia sp. PH5-24]